MKDRADYCSELLRLVKMRPRQLADKAARGFAVDDAFQRMLT